MLELALDNDQRNAFVSDLNRVRVPQLMRGEPATDTGERGRPSELLASGGGLPVPTSVLRR